MTTKHTPGPWKVYEDSHSDAYEVMPDQCDVGDTIAVYGRTRKANARLIAAAPDLLHALKWAAEYVSLYTGNGAGWTGVQQGHDRERFIDDDTGSFDVEGLRAFLSETIAKAEEG